MASEIWRARRILMWCVAAAAITFILHEAYLRFIVAADPPDHKRLIGTVLFISAPLIGGLLSSWKTEQEKLRVPAVVIINTIVVGLIVLR